jgi:hypothetical protein
MTNLYEDAGKFGKEFVESGMTSMSALSKGAQTIAVEATDYTKKAYETGTATLEKLFAAKSLEAAIEIQTDYARKAYESFVAEASKFGGLYADIAKDAYKPYEGMLAKVK